ncbi:MAG: response regulator [Ginsengibacter sp.]
MEHILIVNNDEDTMSLLKMWLEKKNYKVTYTSKRDEVPKIVKEYNPRLIIVDVLQKEVVETLRIDEETSKVPVLLMTGYTQRQNLSTIQVDDMIEKPFNLRLLEKKIERLVS